ncbi:DUF4831 family protein [Thermophagus xiamenensis]|jgi:hypothetical protein|uniref:DUF4831 domain-containing protein n=1 Tax=Thermophagus xiamenensis TaxID=385682 RepID=A0A1I1W548_9BACT|nr:DUF4831 family protein [Thermophagus xiamenensis]SFD88463.1 protein of unknown function [Thermophagus xiamenensis]
MRQMKKPMSVLNGKLYFPGQYLIYGLFLLMMVSCNAQQNISQGNVFPAREPLPQEGIYYHLPLTVINVEVTARQTTEKRGPYYRYSQRFLNLNDIITEDRTTWEIVDARIYTTGIPDPNRIFRITAQGNPSLAAVALTPDGILRGINIDEPRQNGVQPPKQFMGAMPENDLSFDDVPFTEEQLIKTSSAATAEEVAAEIYRLRDARRRLLESDLETLPPDNGAYERILNGINELENQYLSLFKGKKETFTVTKVFSIIPDTSMSGNQVLFRFSERKGFTDQLDLTGTPVYIEIESVSPIANRSLNLPDKQEQRTGLVYCKPSKAHIKIIDRTVLLTETDVLIGQFGSLHQLPPTLFDDPSITLKLDTRTGALLNIKTQRIDF